MRAKTHWQTCLALIAMACSLTSPAFASKCGGVAEGKSTGGAYFSQGVPYEQDVFSFCAIGVPAHCWTATGPGTWTQICQYLNTKWIPKFEEVCVHGKQMGMWKGKGGRQPLSTKGDPKGSDGMSECEHGDDF
ncbi:hypothetical protein [Hydrogenophaga sp.]|uniref:hypothetical protein n=1 Tax=Hydrogenophaga sp. TaxID=1904254 RepID=UPI0035AE07F3